MTEPSPKSQANKRSTVVTLRLPNAIVEKIDAEAELKARIRGTAVKRGEALRERILEVYGAAESS